MSRPKGLAKTGGRTKGTPNRDVLSIELLEQYNFNPLNDLIAILPQLPPESKAATLLKLMEFIFPKRRSIELKADELENGSYKTLSDSYSDSKAPTVIRIVAAGLHDGTSLKAQDSICEPDSY
jgi:hypothetical protein